MVIGVNGLVGQRVLPAVEMVLSIEQGKIGGVFYNIIFVI